MFLPHHASTRRHVLSTLLLGSVLMAAACAPKPAVDAPPRSVVFFTAFSADLDGNAQAVIQQVASDAAANPRRTVYVEGYADSAGSSSANQKLSDLRAQVVTDALVAHGIARSRMRLRPRGAAAGDPGVESRRVDVSFGN